MNRAIQHNEGLTLIQHSEQAQFGPITEARIRGVPEPLQRYLRYAQVVNKAPISTVRLKQEGAMRIQPGKPWLPMVANQCFTTTSSGVPLARHDAILPFVWVSATDQFSQNHGTMRIKLLSVAQWEMHMGLQ